MTSPAHGRSVVRWGPVTAMLALLLAALAGVLAVPAVAATGTVTLDNNGPTPQTITITRGDKVRFVNRDSASHTITHSGGPWSFTATIPAGGSATTPAFATAGQYAYRDSFLIAVLQQNVNGLISVQPSGPSPTPKPSATPSASTSPRPSPTARPSSSSSPTPSASTTPSGQAIGPGIIGGLPTPVATTGPTPNVAPPETAAPSETPVVVAYGGTSEIVQSSAHRYGLPVLLALLAAVGVLSLLLRLLLAEAPGVRRTGEEGPEARP